MHRGFCRWLKGSSADSTRNKKGPRVCGKDAGGPAFFGTVYFCAVQQFGQQQSGPQHAPVHEAQQPETFSLSVPPKSENISTSSIMAFLLSCVEGVESVRFLNPQNHRPENGDDRLARTAT